MTSLPIYLAPMEAVNCASFRVLCMRRGADMVYTDMIDADTFTTYANEHSTEEAIKKYINPQPDEVLAVQIGGRDVQNLLFLADAVKHVVKEINFNLGCPLGYMLGKKGGAYLTKHPGQLKPILKQLREGIKLPFTIKIRSGWDEQSVNALEIANMAQEAGIDAVIIHPRTRTQRYRDKADWLLVKRMKARLTIPVVLSGDIYNKPLLDRAVSATGCDAVMCGRGAQVNPSIFRMLKDGLDAESTKQFKKFLVDPKKDFAEWLDLYKERESRYRLDEVRDHAIWTANECRNAKEVKQQLLGCEDEQEIASIIREISF